MAKRLTANRVALLLSILNLVWFAYLSLSIWENIIESSSPISLETAISQTFKETYPDCIAISVKLMADNGRMIIATECTEWQDINQNKIKKDKVPVKII